MIAADCTGETTRAISGSDSSAEAGKSALRETHQGDGRDRGGVEERIGDHRRRRGAAADRPLTAAGTAASTEASPTIPPDGTDPAGRHNGETR